MVFEALKVIQDNNHLQGSKLINLKSLFFSSRHVGDWQLCLGSSPASSNRQNLDSIFPAFLILSHHVDNVL